MNTSKPFDLQAASVVTALDRLQSTLDTPSTLFKEIAGALEEETFNNFAAQGRPEWVPLSKVTMTERLKRNRGGSVLKVLQDSGILAKSISSEYGDDYAMVGAGGAAGAYAAIHQFGGSITYPPRSSRVRLRTDGRGNLLRQGDEGSASGRAIFAKETGERAHKRYQESWHEVGEYTVNIPARPYLPFKSSGEIQPEAQEAVMEIVQRHLLTRLGE